jgi:hypothetical protein
VHTVVKMLAVHAYNLVLLCIKVCGYGACTVARQR